MSRSTALRILSAAALVSLVSSAPSAQQTARLQPADYGRWEQLVAQRMPLSPDGKWLVYGITRSSRQNELRVQPSDGGVALR